MEINGFKLVGSAVVAAGLLTGTFFAGSLASTSGRADPEPSLTPTVIYKVVQEPVVMPTLVTPDQASAPSVEEAGPEEPQQPPAQQPQQDPAPPTSEATQPVDPAPVQPTPVPAAPEPANEAPYVVSIAPTDGAIGIEPNAKIIVTFSEPMDEMTTEAAFSLSTGSCGSFSWNGDDTEMTFDPCVEIAYGTVVGVQVDESAADKLALGMDDEFDSSFRVLRQETKKVYSDDAYDGYVWAPKAFVPFDRVVSDGETFLVGTQVRGFLSFDLHGLPEDLVRIESATVHVRQKFHGPETYTSQTGNLLIRSVTYRYLTADDWGMASNSVFCHPFCPSSVLSSNAADGWKSIETAGFVRADWQYRADRGYMSQFRLQFAHDCDGESCPNRSAVFYSGAGTSYSRVFRPYLLITYTHP